MKYQIFMVYHKPEERTPFLWVFAEIFVLYTMSGKKKFPFSVIASKTNICFCQNDRKREILFSWHCVQNKYLNVWGCFVQIHVRFSAQKRVSRGYFQFLVWVLKHPFSCVIFWDGKTFKIMSSFFLHFSLVRFKHQLLVFDKMTEKGNFFFPVLVPETNICVPTPNYLFMTDGSKKEQL